MKPIDAKVRRVAWALLLAAATPSSGAAMDLYLVIDPTQEERLGRDFPGLAIEPMLATAQLEKLGLAGWRRASATDADVGLLPRLQAHSAVRLAEEVPILKLSGWPADDPGLRAQWHLQRIGAPEAWSRCQGSRDVVVAIVDTGVNWHHEDLADRIRVNPGEDLDGDGHWTAADWNDLDDDQNGYIDDGIGWDLVNLPPSQLWPGEDGAPADNDPDDFNGHGTHCAGDAAAAGYNGLGVASPAPRALILPIRAGYTGTDGMGYVSHGLEGMLLAAAMGADVVSMSFGGSGFSQIWQDAVGAVHGQGVVLLAAAGNESSSFPSYPAAYAQMIAVGATNRQDQRASFSNYGSWVDIGAPGTEILSTSVGGAYAVMGGTSMATPVAAGVAALIKTVYPDWTGEQVLARMAATADPLPGQDLGAGRIHAGHALQDEAWVESLGAADTGRLVTGVPGQLRIAVHTGAQPLASGVLSLLSDDPRLPLDALPLSVGFLPPWDSDTLDLDLTWTGPGLVDLVLQGELFDGPDLFWRGVVAVPCGVAEMLLIEGDSSDNWSLLGWYVDALSSLGIAAEVHRLAWENTADLPWSRAQRLILFTGSDLDPQVDSAFEDSLQVFLARGGRAILSGQRLAQALGTTFLSEVAGAQLQPQDPSSVQVWGDPSLPDVADLHLLLTGSGGAGNQASPQIVTAAGGRTLFTWTPGDSLRGAGVRSADGRLDLLTFGLEAINGDPEWGASLTEVLAILFETESDLAAPRAAALSSALACWPNPFNPALRVAILGDREMELSVYNLGGQLVDRLGRGRPGEVLTWRPRGLAGGPYFIMGDDGLRRHLQHVIWRP